MPTKHMTPVEAVALVFGLVRIKSWTSAQQAILDIESQGSILPSSVFELVLRHSLLADRLLDEYADFCKRSYGREQYQAIIVAICKTVTTQESY
jgi:hypothetical protein